MASAAELLADLQRGVVVDLIDPDFYADDPEPVYAWLRENDPVYRDLNGLWCISRHTDIQQVEKESHRYTSSQGTRPLIDMSSDQSIITLDDPRHVQQRRLVQRRFTPAVVRSHADHVRDIAVELVNAVRAKGHVEVVSELASVLPAVVICELLGFDRSRWEDCRRWAADTLSAGSLKFGDPRMADFGTALGEFITATSELIAMRRESPQDDLVSVWAHSTVDGEPMSDKTILEEALLLLDGGAETSRNVIAGGVLALLENPDQLDLVRNDPGLLETSGVEELIRWVTPIMNMSRIATEDHEFHGRSIAKGDGLLLMYSAANRDEHAFTEPQKLDLRRGSNHHVAFGYGTHYCLGANLARFEIRVMIEEILSLPGLRLTPGTTPEIVPSFFTRGLAALHLDFETVAP